MLISLTEHNREIFNKHKNSKRVSFSSSSHPCKNGISCPICGKELWDSNPFIMVTSRPPQTKVHCDCGYKSYRYC